MTTRRVIQQGESREAVVDGIWVGFTLYGLDEGRYEAVVHNRTYDGIRVRDQFDSAAVTLDATDEAAAKAEVRRLARAMRAALGAEVTS